MMYGKYIIPDEMDEDNGVLEIDELLEGEGEGLIGSFVE